MTTRSVNDARAEADRLDTLTHYQILDTPPEQSFDELTQLAAIICNTPVALVSLVTADRQWFKSRIGFEPSETSIEKSVCAHALGSTDLLVIDDLTSDARTARNPLVTDDPNLRFYAGAPLVAPNGAVLGTLCVIDRSVRPGGLTEGQRSTLKILARQIMAQMELNRAVAERDSAIADQQRTIRIQDALIETQNAISSAGGDWDTVFKALLTGALAAVPQAEAGVLAVPDGEHEIIYRQTEGALKPATDVRMPIVGSISGACFTSGEAMLCPDVELDPRVEHSIAARINLRSCVLVPVKRGRTTFGVLKLSSSRANAFSDADVQTARLFAGAASAGLAEVGEAQSRRSAFESESRYRAVFESAIDHAMVVLDLQGRITNWNSGAVRTLGWSVEEILGQSAELFFTPEDRRDNILTREMESARINGRGVDERWHLRKDGSLFWANGEMMPLTMEGGEAVGYLKILRDRTAQHEAEERIIANERQLRLERGLLRAVLQQAPVGISIAYADSGSMVNTKLQSMMGHEASGSEIELRYADYGALHQDGRPYAVDEYPTVRALLKGEVVASEPMLYRNEATGEIRRWIVSSAPIRGEHGDISAAVSIVLDVEDQRRAHEALQISEERLALAFESSGSQGWWDWDITRNKVFASHQLAKMFGIEPAVAATGASVEAFIQAIHPEDVERVSKAIETAMATAGEFGEEYRLQTKGELLWVYARGRCYQDVNGKPVRFPGVALDITTRKLMEQAAEAQQARLRTIMEAVPVGIVVAEAPSGRIVMTNRRVGMILGQPPESANAMAGKGGLKAFDAEGRRLRWEDWPLARITEGGVDRAHIEAQIERPDGHRVWIEVWGEAIKNGAGQIVGGVVAINEIESRKRAEAAQDLLNHELSHRLKNTLAMVQAIATQTLRNAPDLVMARDSLNQRLVALSQAHEILLTGDVESASVASVVNGSLTLHRDGPERFTVAGPEIMIGPSTALSLALMLHELLTNAVKYGALSVAAGKVSVTWSARDDGPEPVCSLIWREQDGPVVQAPARKGFGSRLIERGFGGAAGGEVELDYRAAGVACALTMPMLRRVG